MGNDHRLTLHEECHETVRLRLEGQQLVTLATDALLVAKLPVTLGKKLKKSGELIFLLLAEPLLVVVPPRGCCPLRLRTTQTATDHTHRPDTLFV